MDQEGGNGNRIRSVDPIERWTAKCCVALVVSFLKGEISVAEAVSQYGLRVAEVEDGGRSFWLGPRTRSAVIRRMKMG